MAKIRHDGCEHVDIGLVSRGAADRRDIRAIGLQHDQIADCGGAIQPVPCNVINGVERIVDRGHIQRANERNIDGNRSIRQRAVDCVEQQRGLLGLGQGDLVDGVVIVAIYQRIIQIRRICRSNANRDGSEDHRHGEDDAQQTSRSMLFHKNSPSLILSAYCWRGGYKTAVFHRGCISTAPIPLRQALAGPASHGNLSSLSAVGKQISLPWRHTRAHRLHGDKPG